MCKPLRAGKFAVETRCEAAGSTPGTARCDSHVSLLDVIEGQLTLSEAVSGRMIHKCQLWVDSV